MVTINLEEGTFHLAKWVSTSGGGWLVGGGFFIVFFEGFKSSQGTFHLAKWASTSASFIFGVGGSVVQI